MCIEVVLQWMPLNGITVNRIIRLMGSNWPTSNKPQMYLNSILCIGICLVIVIILFMESVKVWPKVITLSGLHCTVKPVLTATSEQRPPAINGQPKPGQIKFNSNFDWKASKQRPPIYNGQYFVVPRVAVVDRFDCINLFLNSCLFNTKMCLIFTHWWYSNKIFKFQRRNAINFWMTVEMNLFMLKIDSHVNQELL